MHETGRRFLRYAAGPSSYPITEAVFLRGLGLIFLAAFASLWPQVTGLIGSHGIAPATSALEGLRAELGSRQAFLYSPSVYWWKLNDSLLRIGCAAGCIFSVLLLLSARWARLAALGCWVLYLSFVSIGSPFLTFQWDALLLETGFLALFAGASMLPWAFRFLLFRLMFQSGAIKFLSGDPTWHNLHALRYHFLTQPLPNPIAYYAYRLPDAVLDGVTALTLGIELIAPCLLFGPRRLRQAGTVLLIVLQVAILLTGNFAFFNLLTIVLCLWGLDDRTFASLSQLVRRRSAETGSLGAAGFLTTRVRTVLRNSAVLTAQFVLICYGVLGMAQLILMFQESPGTFLRASLQRIAPLQIVNSYGLFAVMTTTRPELVVEGSNDQDTWLEYNFPYKPGETHRSLPFVAPYQPRLDWQMWFAALGSYTDNSWVSGLLYRILVGDGSVRRLMSPPPFPKPPLYLRIVLYDYKFTTPEERRRTGAVWLRQRQGIWFGPVSLTGR